MSSSVTWTVTTSDQEVWVGNTTVALTAETHEGNSTTGTSVSYQNFVFILNGVILTAVIIFGILGNSLSIIVLRRKTLQNTTTTLLCGLAFYDICYLVAVFFSAALVNVSSSYSYKIYYSSYRTFGNVMYVLINCSLTASVWLTVIVSLQRFLAVCCPFCIMKLDSSCAHVTFAVTTILATCFNIPRIIYACIFPEVTASFKKFMHSYEFVFLAFVFILPTILLVFCNTALALSVRRQKARRKQMTSVKRKKLDEQSLTKILVWVVSVFVVTQAPCIIPRLVIATKGFEYTNEHTFYAVYSQVALFLTAVNSSVNFLLYCLVGHRNFKSELRKIWFNLIERYRKRGNQDNGHRSFRSPSAAELSRINMTTEVSRLHPGDEHKEETKHCNFRIPTEACQEGCEDV